MAGLLARLLGNMDQPQVAGKEVAMNDTTRALLEYIGECAFIAAFMAIAFAAVLATGYVAFEATSFIARNFA